MLNLAKTNNHDIITPEDFNNLSWRTSAKQRTMLEKFIKDKACFEGVNKTITYLESVAMFADNDIQTLFTVGLIEKLLVCQDLRYLNAMNSHRSLPYLAYDLGMKNYTHVVAASGFNMSVSLDAYLKLHCAIKNFKNPNYKLLSKFNLVKGLTKEELICAIKNNISSDTTELLKEKGYSQITISKIMRGELYGLRRLMLEELAILI